MEEEIDLKELLNMFWKKKLIIILITIIFIVLGFIYTKFYVVPKYKSSTTLLLVQNNSNNSQDATTEITQTDIILNKQLVSTYGMLIKSKTVIEQVLQNLNIQYMNEDDVAKNITVSAVNDTQVIEITYCDKDNQNAYLVANELANVFSNKVSEIYNMNNVYIVDKAKLETNAYNINHKKDILLFAIVGLAISCMVIFIISLFDTTIKTKQDIEKNTGLIVVSQIPNMKIEKNKELITHEDPKSPISEVFKTLRTNLQFTHQKSNTLSLLVTSTMPGEGKTWVTSNLGIAFAQANKKVVIIDSDMRKGRLHGVFKTKLFPGFSNYLSEKNSMIKDFLVKTDIENLWIIPAGNVPPNPSELLISEKMLNGFEDLKKDFDIILFDSTPCMLVTDAIIISRIVDDTIIVGSHKSTKLENIKNIQNTIKNVGGTIAGVVINKIPISQKKYKSKYYYYGNRSDEEKSIDREKNTPKKYNASNNNGENNNDESINNKENNNNDDKEKIQISQEDADIMKQIDKFLESTPK